MTGPADSRFAMPVVWSAEHLEADRQTAIAAFRQERLEEPLDVYHTQFEQARAVMDDLLEGSVDLMHLEAYALEAITKRGVLEALRHLTGPFLSDDELKIVAQAPSLAPTTLRSDPALVQRIVQTVLAGLDRGRFPWYADQREPTPEERQVARLASATLMATNRTATIRRNDSRQRQEAQVRSTLMACGLTPVKIKKRKFWSMDEAPKPGEFCDEVSFGEKKADFIVRLWDRRLLLIECKVSNTAVNSIKRLIREAVGKATIWRDQYGTVQIISAAVLSGVYDLHNLQQAQNSGLVLYWTHRLSDLHQFIDLTRNGSGDQHFFL